MNMKSSKSEIKQGFELLFLDIALSPDLIYDKQSGAGTQ